MKKQEGEPDTSPSDASRWGCHLLSGSNGQAILQHGKGTAPTAHQKFGRTAQPSTPTA